MMSVEVRYIAGFCCFMLVLEPCLCHNRYLPIDYRLEIGRLRVKGTRWAYQVHQGILSHRQDLFAGSHLTL